MLTRETALERLRTAGTLMTSARPQNAINPREANTPNTVRFAAVVADTKSGSGPRHLAPAACQVILP